MTRKIGRVGYVFRAVVIVIAALLAIGYAYEKFAESRDNKRFPPPGQLVDVAGRQLHLNCLGKGSPTVVIETGSGHPSFHWWNVQMALAKSSQVCTYDRPGYGWSDPASRGRSIEDRANELHQLLLAAHIAGPYVLVGHSYGGLVVRSYSHRYPDEVAGIALIDAAEEGAVFTPEFLEFNRQSIPGRRILQQVIRFGVARVLLSLQPRERIAARLAISADMIDRVGLTVAGISPEYMDAYIDEAASLASTPEAMRAAGGFGGLGELPLVVIEHGIPYSGASAFMETHWHEAQLRLSQLSTQGKLITAQKSGHYIYADEPDVVVNAISSLVSRLADSSKTYSSTQK
jgi:pimeloyl-ACP methyl ester carboxylesterase